MSTPTEDFDATLVDFLHDLLHRGRASEAVVTRTLKLWALLREPMRKIGNRLPAILVYDGGDCIQIGFTEKNLVRVLFDVPAEGPWEMFVKDYEDGSCKDLEFERLDTLPNEVSSVLEKLA